MQAIEAHYFSSNQYCDQVSNAQLFYVLTTKSVYEPEFSSISCNSEANSVVNSFNALSSSQQQDLLNFLRSLQSRAQWNAETQVPHSTPFASFETVQREDRKPSLYGFFSSFLNTSFYPGRAALRVHSLSQALLMPSITALLHTENDALRLGRALETLYPCDEILVIDHGSRDGTVQVARDYGARVLSATPEASVKHYLRSVPGWILSLDARESLSESLAASLYEWKSLHSASPPAPAFAVFLREETSGGWIESPVPQTRLVPATWPQWNGNLPSHDANALTLEGELLRFVFP